MNAIAYYGPEIFKMNLAVQRSGTFEWGVIPDGGRCSRTVWYRPSSSSIFKNKYIAKVRTQKKKQRAVFPFRCFVAVYPFFQTSAMISNERSLSAWSNVSELIMISSA